MERGVNEGHYLRQLAEDSLKKYMFESAIFFADKLVTITHGPCHDILLLARAYYGAGESRRAYHILESNGLEALVERGNIHFALLAAQCLVSQKRWEDCNSLLDGFLRDDGNLVLQIAAKHRSADSSEINVVAVLCMLRGSCYDHAGKVELAKSWRLLDRGLLTSEEEAELMKELSFGSRDSLIEAFYVSQIEKHRLDKNANERFGALETQFALQDNLEVMAIKAVQYFHEHNIMKCYDLAKRIRDRDPYHTACIPVFIASMVKLNKKSELFYLAHQLVDASPESSLAWFGVGAYYMLIKKYDAAQRYFSKATTLDSQFAPAWVGFGNAFAAQDESDQALAAYRTASRLFPGSHTPLLAIGMEYFKTNNLGLADQFMTQALSLCPSDPLLYNELGVVHFKKCEYDKAIKMFEEGLSKCKDIPPYLEEVIEPLVFNLGHCYRKLRLFDEAIAQYERALSLAPNKASTYSALGFTHQLSGKPNVAVEMYHKALGLKPEDTLASEMLSRALVEQFQTPQLFAINGPFGGVDDVSGFGSMVLSSRPSQESMDMSMNSSSFMSAATGEDLDDSMLFS